MSIYYFNIFTKFLDIVQEYYIINHKEINVIYGSMKALELSKIVIYLLSGNNKTYTKTVNLLKLMQLVYLCHGYYAGHTGERLINEDIQAWKSGPVIPEIYHQYKGNFQEIKITQELLASGKDMFEKLKEEESKLIKKVVEFWGKESTEDIYSRMHHPDTPWSKNWNGEYWVVIPFNEIREFYKEAI